MVKKFAVLAVTAILALVLLPATAANAATAGKYVGCYGIKKKGNYNDVRLGLLAFISGGKVKAYASEQVSPSCQRTNSIPIINMDINYVILSVNGVHVGKSAKVINNGKKAKITATTAYHSVKCGASIVIYANVAYSYYDKSRVRPFTIHSKAFKRC